MPRPGTAGHVNGRTMTKIFSKLFSVKLKKIVSSKISDFLSLFRKKRPPNIHENFVENMLSVPTLVHMSHRGSFCCVELSYIFGYVQVLSIHFTYTTVQCSNILNTVQYIYVLYSNILDSFKKRL